MNARLEKIEKLQVRLEQLQAAEKAAAQRARAAAIKRERADDTRRKILVGAFVLAHVSVEDVRRFTLGDVLLSSWLTRADDRALFGLAAPSDGAAAAAPAALPARPSQLAA